MRVDLRSDMLSRPTAAMRRAMDEAAEVPPGFWPREDPVVCRLERLAADMLGKEDALFCPTCALANEIAIHIRCRRNETFVAEPSAHVVLYEQSAFGILTGVVPKLVPATDFAPDPDHIHRALRPTRPLDPRIGLIWIENTHAHFGGAVVRPDTMKGIRDLSIEFGVPVHLDGARIFNAAVALGVPADELAAMADTVSLSLNKGLGAPLGAVLAGPADVIAEAVRVRQLFGGGWRPATIPAAAGVVALETMVDRLADDHRNAKRLAEGLSGLEGIRVEAGSAFTNMVFATPDRPDFDAAALAERLSAAEVLVGVYEPGMIRMVTHGDIDEAAVSHVLDVFSNLLQRPFPT